MSDDELAQVQKDIDEQLEMIRIGWLRLATADFDPEERKRIRDGIMSNEDQSTNALRLNVKTIDAIARKSLSDPTFVAAPW